MHLKHEVIGENQSLKSDFDMVRLHLGDTIGSIHLKRVRLPRAANDALHRTFSIMKSRSCPMEQSKKVRKRVEPDMYT